MFTKVAGALLIDTLPDQQESRLLALKKIGDLEIEVSPHATLHTKWWWAVTY